MATKKAAIKNAAAKKSASKVPAAVSKEKNIIKTFQPVSDELLVTAVLDDQFKKIEEPEENPAEKKKSFISHKKALVELKQGKKIRRKDWQKSEYLEVIEGITYRSITDKRKDLYEESTEDNTAEDWQTI